MAFDGLAVSCMVHELNDILTNGRVDKVLQPEYDEIILGVRAGGKNRRLVLSASSSNPRVHLTSVQKENPEKAHSQPKTALLQKLLTHIQKSQA